MATKTKPIEHVRKPRTKSAEQVQAAEVRKADAAVRLEYHQHRQREANRLRAQYGYMGDDETVFAMHWLATAFRAEPSLAKWASQKTVHGRKPSPVELKRIVFDWLCQPVCAVSRGRVYEALTNGAL